MDLPSTFNSVLDLPKPHSRTVKVFPSLCVRELSRVFTSASVGGDWLSYSSVRVGAEAAGKTAFTRRDGHSVGDGGCTAAGREGGRGGYKRRGLDPLIM